ncbi:MAG TPA: hypothetical protein VL463_24335, partial [Kofleriaceae bacterium]|nr:hypothetical protein [Kofleriaceae bacterium]
MRVAALLVLGGCHFASIDPEAMLAEHAGPAASACGAAQGAAPHGSLTRGGAVEWSGLYDARDCVLTARAERRAWWVSIDQGVADGRELTGFADDGTQVIEI